MEPWIVQLIEAAVVGGAVYGGIRADLRALHEKVSAAASSASRAHERIDQHLEHDR